MKWQWTLEPRQAGVEQEVDVAPPGRTLSIFGATLWCAMTIGFDCVLLLQEWPFLDWFNGISSRPMRGFDWFLLAFLLPFNLFAIGFILAPLFWLWELRHSFPPGHFIDHVQNSERLRLSLGAHWMFALWLSVMACAAMLAIALTTWAGLPLLFRPIISFIAAVVVIVLTIRSRRRLLDGQSDLIFCHFNCTLSLPPTSDRKRRIEIPYANLESFRIRHFKKYGIGGDDPSFETNLVLDTKDNQSIVVLDSLPYFQNQRLVDWLNQKLDALR